MSKRMPKGNVPRYVLTLVVAIGVFMLGTIGIRLLQCYDSITDAFVCHEWAPPVFTRDEIMFGLAVTTIVLLVVIAIVLIVILVVVSGERKGRGQR